MTNEEAITRMKEIIDECLKCVDDDNKDVQALRLAVKALEERPKGKWVGDTDYESFQGSYEAYKCSNCGYSLHWRDYYADEYIFCPYCGADMRGDVWKE